ncbi:MAG: NAD(P)H-dependent oxidoreductase subunit E, partial [Polyangia bacterium]|nr:NAD(P)H-dependent oxidoreductase subunit E [Polyangia bacterium]
MTLDMQKVDEVLGRTPRERAQVIQVLQDMQQVCRYLPPEVLRRVASHLQIPLADVFSVAKFYAAFSLEPRGRVLVQLCEGTACHVRGALGVGDAIKTSLGLPAQGGTTSDMEFTLQAVNCVGACALGPVVVAN